MDTGFLTRSIQDGDDRRLYQVYVPSDYDPAHPWPAILFLHGAGEGGRDSLLPTEFQLGSAIRRNAAGYPGLVVFPQVPSYQPVWTSAEVDFALRVLGQVRDDFSVDPDRVYITGVSTGAKAAWHALYRNPELFAAALIVCGIVRPRRRDGTRIPIWTFHGDADPVFPVSDAREVMAALAAAAAPVRYTELEGFGHDVWDVAYYSPDVVDWLFAQARSD
jgi:predicted peptidase